MSRKNLKILLISPYSAEKVGGIGTWTKIMLDYCPSRDEIEFVFQNTASKLPKRTADNNKIAHILIGSLDSLSIIFKVFWNLLTKQPAVVHYTSSAAFALHKDRIVAFMVTRIFRKKMIIHWRFGRIPQIFKEKGREYSMMWKVIKLTTASIVIDQRSYKALSNAGVPNVYCLPNPISPGLQQMSKNIDVSVIRRNRQEGTVLFVGHVLKTKGIFELVEACSECDKVKKLIVIGPFFDSTLKDQLIKIAAKRDDGNWIEWKGELKREDVFGYYQTCDIFCLPSYTEGFPNTVIEALANDCPVIATDVGAIPEILDSGCGICIPSQSKSKLLKALDYALSHEEDMLDMGDKGRNKVLSEYTIESIYQEYYKIWSKE